MLVKCIAVPRERTPKKVEVILSRIVPAQKNTVKLNVRVAQQEVFVEETISAPAPEIPEADDNLSGIMPSEGFYTDDDDIVIDDVDELTEIFFEETDEIMANDEPEVSISEINADFEELENDLRYQLGDDEIDDEEVMDESEDAIIQRHFVRNDTGELFASDSESADGHEVACYDNTGKLKRACGVIRKNQPLETEDDVYSAAVHDMFPDSEI